MSINRIARVVSICLITSLLLAAPAAGNDTLGRGGGSNEIGNLSGGFTAANNQGIQPASSDLFHPYINLVTNVNANAVGVGDFNHDGSQDVVMGGKDYSTNIAYVYILLQDSFGNLTSPAVYPTEGEPQSLCVGDLNHDSWDDVAVINYGVSKMSVYLQQANGTLGSATTFNVTIPEDAVCGDFTGDGRDDVAEIGYDSGTLKIFVQQENGTLSAVNYETPSSSNNDIDIGDLNGDGLTDIVKIQGTFYANPNLAVHLQNGSGGLSPYATYDIGNINASGGAVGDLNGDGLNDVVMGYHTASWTEPKLRVWLQNESHVLVDSATIPAYAGIWPIETADINNDGLTDIILAHQDMISVFLQQPDHTLGAYELYPIPSGLHFTQGLEVADVNGDGWQDILIADRFIKGLFVLYNKGADIFLSTETVKQKVDTGSSGQFEIQVLKPAGFVDPVDLEVDGLPSGATAAWSINPVESSDTSSTLTVNVGTEVPDGTYPLTITATSGLLQDQMQVSLTVVHLEMVYLPAVLRTKTTYYWDDFSNPASGWWVETTDVYSMGYVGGEYQIDVLQPGYIVWSTPGHSLTDFVVSIDARKQTTVPTGLGIVIMDSNNPPDQFYAFVISPDDQAWALIYKYYMYLDYEILPVASTSIKSGTQTNQLKVSRVGAYVTFSINGTVVLSNYTPIYNWTGSRRIGLTALAFDVGGADARFDNYLVTEP